MYLKIHPMASRVKLPYGMDLAIKSIIIMQTHSSFHEHGKFQLIMQQRIFVMEAVGILFLLRCSEHINPKLGTAIILTRMNVIFLDRNQSVVPYSKVGLIKA